MPKPVPNPFSRYVHPKDGAFQWTSREVDAHVARLEMVSQNWQGSPWNHTITIANPEELSVGETAILVITGGQPNSADEAEARWLCDAAHLPVATLYNIPNQPLYGLMEDELVAETFARYHETGDTSWPLLLPMTTAALRSMDAVQEFSAKSEKPITKFVLTGSSKRGWTTWLAAASGDDRIAGIAPMVYDNLNIAKQLTHQIMSWGGQYSEMIVPYTSRRLHESIGSSSGKHLLNLVEPYNYRHGLVLPKLIVTGTNDPYWSVDSTSLYWDGLVGAKYVRTVPNGGHGEFGEAALATVAAFARSCAKQIEMPAFTWRHESDAIWLDIQSQWKSARMWLAESATLDFRASKWSAVAECGPGVSAGAQKEFCFRFPRSRLKQAVMAEVSFEVNGLGFDLTTTVKVVG